MSTSRTIRNATLQMMNNRDTKRLVWSRPLTSNWKTEFLRSWQRSRFGRNMNPTRRRWIATKHSTRSLKKPNNPMALLYYQNQKAEQRPACWELSGLNAMYKTGVLVLYDKRGFTKSRTWNPSQGAGKPPAVSLYASHKVDIAANQLCCFFRPHRTVHTHFILVGIAP